jgi:hypothetical protein
VTKDYKKYARFGERDIKILDYLRHEKVEDDDSKLIRLGLRALKYCYEKGIEVPA